LGRRPRIEMCAVECAIYNETCYTVAREVRSEIQIKKYKGFGIPRDLNDFSFNIVPHEFICKE